MSIRRTLFVIIALTVLAAVASVAVYPRLPEMVPSHWNAAGEVDGYMSRTSTAIFMPLMILGLGLLLLYIPKLDPLRANVDQFRSAYNWAVVGLAAFMVYMHGLTLATGLGARFNMVRFMLPVMGLLFVGLGFMIQRAKRNWFIGIRTPWTLSNDVVWEKTHRLGGLLFKLAGGVVIVSVFAPVSASFWLMMAATMVAGLVPVVYSYLVFRAEQR